MTNEERAKQYAALFTHLGRRWRECVPVDGSPDKAQDRLLLHGVTIERPDDSEVWRIVAPVELTDQEAQAYDDAMAGGGEADAAAEAEELHGWMSRPAPARVTRCPPSRSTATGGPTRPARSVTVLSRRG